MSVSFFSHTRGRLNVFLLFCCLLCFVFVWCVCVRVCVCGFSGGGAGVCVWGREGGLSMFVCVGGGGGIGLCGSMCAFVDGRACV